MLQSGMFLCFFRSKWLFSMFCQRTINRCVFFCAESRTANCSAERPTRHSVLELSTRDQCIIRRRNTLQTDCFCRLRAITTAALPKRACTAPHRKPLPLSSAHFSTSPPLPSWKALSFHSSRESEKPRKECLVTIENLEPKWPRSQSLRVSDAMIDDWQDAPNTQCERRSRGIGVPKIHQYTIAM